MPSSARRSLMKFCGSLKAATPTRARNLPCADSAGVEARHYACTKSTSRYERFCGGSKVSPADYTIHIVQDEILRRGQGLACRLGRCFCILTYAEVSTGDPHPRPTDYASYVVLIEILRSAQNDRPVADRLRANEGRPYSRFFT